VSGAAEKNVLGVSDFSIEEVLHMESV